MTVTAVVKIPCFGCGNFCTPLGVELQVLTFGYLYAFEAGFHIFFCPARRHHLMKHDAKLSISAEPARTARLQDGALQSASLRKKQVMGDNQRLRNNRLHRIPLLALYRTEWRD